MNDQKAKASRRFISPPELAKRWAISVATAYRLAGTELPVLRIGCSVRVPLEAVEAYEKRQLGSVPAEIAS